MTRKTFPHFIEMFMMTLEVFQYRTKQPLLAAHHILSETLATQAVKDATRYERRRFRGTVYLLLQLLPF